MLKDYSQALARPIQQPKKSLISGRLFTVKSVLLFNGQNKTNSVSASGSPFISLMDFSRKISPCAIDRDVSRFLHKFPEESIRSRTHQN
ncbi:hypothetical protein TNCV_2853171 [Trichonephila clavipes]|uniref:Uncharacterized protein n=1 Tax=Trichonephila clavipes TaxID=2585209 RepID=A0A8X6RAM8_TRICX|nr:hypothetical protein TNCV_2853171 [Trichonephila clavipes]